MDELTERLVDQAATVMASATFRAENGHLNPHQIREAAVIMFGEDVVNEVFKRRIVNGSH